MSISAIQDMTDINIWTIGHFNHSMDDFVRLLTEHQIQLLVDVRRFPGSRKFPHFNRETIGPALAEKGMDYLWIESLGGRRSQSSTLSESPNEGWRNKSFRNYADYMLTDTFRVGFTELARRAAVQRTAIMCAESVYWRCHRRLISDYVVANGGSVQHIFPDGRTKPHTMTENAQVNLSAKPVQITYPP